MTDYAVCRRLVRDFVVDVAAQSTAASSIQSAFALVSSNRIVAELRSSDERVCGQMRITLVRSIDERRQHLWCPAETMYECVVWYIEPHRRSR